MTEASSLYNLLRNLGGSVGIAFVTTVVSRRAQFHQARLVEHLSPFDPAYLFFHDKLSSFLGSHGLPASGADSVMYRELVRQSTALAFNDAFLTICLLMIFILPLVFIMKRPEAH
jgi:DHA2 family multidrug resistance protein